MPFTDTYHRIPLQQIQVDRDNRQRKKLDVTDLLVSIKSRGVMNPVIVEAREGALGQELWLVAGERRLEASKALGLPDIPARLTTELSSIELSIIELEENYRRADLTWQDQARGIAKIHELYRELDSGWTVTETAEALGFNSQGHASLQLAVASALDDPKIFACGTAREAWNIIQRRNAREQGSALQELLDITGEILPGGEIRTEGPEAESPGGLEADWSQIVTDMEPRPKPQVPSAPLPIPSDVQNLDFIEWSETYSGPKFNLIHCDFPYGVGLFSGQQGRSGEPTEYNDSEETYTKLLVAFCKNLNNFMSYSAHLMFWYSEKHGEITRKIFRELAPDLDFHIHPLIWLKSDNSGIAGDHRRHPRHIYETCLLASRGKRQIVQIVGDAYSAPSDRSQHPSNKPEPMLRHFMTMLVDEYTLMLDPTCGGGSSLRAAESLGARRVLGLELDPGFAEGAKRSLESFRLLKSSRASNAAAAALL